MTRVLAQRLRAQLLSGAPATSVIAVVERLLAVQAQDPRGARLSIRSRSTGLAAADVDSALTDDRSVVISTLNRGTLHLVRSEDYWWLHPLTTPQLTTASTRRLRQEGVSAPDAERGVEVVTASLTANGPMTREALRQRLLSAGVPVAGQALVHVLLLATLRGLVVRGPMTGTDHAFVLVRDWLGKPPKAIDRDNALGRLAERYLAGHGPADAGDLARWAGIPLGEARRGLATIATRIVERADGLAELRGSDNGAELPPPRLLGAFEPSLLGWASREQITGDHTVLVTTNGIFRPFAMVRGEAVATWGLAGGKVSLTPLARIGREDRAALDRDADAVLRFLGR